jgi:Lon protease-like protein
MDLPAEIPVMTLPNAILFPGVMLPLYIYEPRYRKMLTDALESHRMFAVAMQKPGEKKGTPSSIAGLGLIRAAVTHKDGNSHLVLQGTGRIRLTNTLRKRPYRLEEFSLIEPEEPADVVTVTKLTGRVLDLVKERFKQGLPLPLLDQFLNGMKRSKSANKKATTVAIDNILEYLSQMEDPEQLADLVSCTLLPTAAQRQAILEAVDVKARLEHLILFLLTEIERGKAEQ